MSDYPRLENEGLLYFTQQIKQKINDAVPGDMTGASAAANGAKGLVPQPNAGQNNQFLRGDGVWATPETPTKTSDLTNDSDFATNQGVTDAIADALSDVSGISYQIVTELPEAGTAGVIYLISNSGSTPNIYDEYIYVNGGWEKIGSTDIDLSGYVQGTELTAISNTQIDAIIDEVFGD